MRAAMAGDAAAHARMQLIGKAVTSPSALAALVFAVLSFK